MGPWSNGYPMWDVDSAIEIQFPACARSQTLTLGKSADLNHSLNGGLPYTSNALLRRSPFSIYIKNHH